MKKNIWLFPLTLFIFVSVIVAGLWGLNILTKDKIEILKYEEKMQASESVIAGIEYEDFLDFGDYIVYFDKDKKILAIVCEETTLGYGGEINSVVGVKFEGGEATVSGVKVISQSETPGLGSNGTTTEFLGQFIDKKQDIKVSKTAPKDNEIKAITGATITSSAITEAVNDGLQRALEIFKDPPNLNIEACG